MRPSGSLTSSPSGFEKSRFFAVELIGLQPNPNIAKVTSNDLVLARIAPMAVIICSNTKNVR